MRFQQGNAHSEKNMLRLTDSIDSVSKILVEQCVRDEQPRSLGDILMRRLGLGWMPGQGLALARPVAEIAAPRLGWSQERVDAEVAAYKIHLNVARRRPSDALSVS